MAEPDEARTEALRRLSERAKALEARTAEPEPRDFGMKAAGYGYRLMGLLVGGVLVGFALGAAIDWLTKSPPWGMIGGVLSGFAVSVWMAVRSAQRMTAEAAREWGPPKDLPFEDDEDD